MTPQEFQLGSISTGTLKAEDLLPRFIDELVHYGVVIPSETDHYLEMGDTFWSSNVPLRELDTMTNALQELCPPFVYFGAHSGDGADFGFWVDWDALDDALEHGICVYNDGDQVFDDCIVELSNYGANITVMDLNRNVLWQV